MKKLYTLVVLAAVLFTTIACLDFEFGNDEETTMPTESQVNRCRVEMYLKDTANITALGYKLEGSGIDDVIWFKFHADAKNLAQVFDTSIVDITQFEENSKVMGLKDVEWWDVDGKNLFGGQVALPNARFMTVGAEKVEGGYVIYVVWNET